MKTIKTTRVSLSVRSKFRVRAKVTVGLELALGRWWR